MISKKLAKREFFGGCQPVILFLCVPISRIFRIVCWGLFFVVLYVFIHIKKFKRHFIVSQSCWMMRMSVLGFT